MTSSMILIGIGGAAANVVKGVRRAYGPNLRALIVDSDAASGNDTDIPFVLIGANRLSGRGAGGDTSAVRAAFSDEPTILNRHLEGIRIAVIATSLGGGTGGATGEIVHMLSDCGICTIVFATLPFSFEGDKRMLSARSAFAPIERDADVSVQMPLDRLMADLEDGISMNDALSRATDIMSSAITIFWRVIEKPGYIKLDAERLRNAIHGKGRAGFAIAHASGNDRAATIVSTLSSGPMLFPEGWRRTRSILMGILAGDDLRLSEVAQIANGFRNAVDAHADFALGTVNDEDTFTGRIYAVALIFDERVSAPGTRSRKGLRRNSDVSARSGRFAGTEPTIVNSEDMDIPTYLRRNLTLER